MRTIIVWEEKDIKGGVWFFKTGLDMPLDDTNLTEFNLSYFVSTAAMIGYNPVGIASKVDPGLPETGYTAVSLSDGNVLSFMDMDKLLHMLNSNSYILLPEHLLVKLIFHKNKS